MVIGLGPGFEIKLYIFELIAYAPRLCFEPRVALMICVFEVNVLNEHISTNCFHWPLVIEFYKLISTYKSLYR